jgi:hypothetical protein
MSGSTDGSSYYPMGSWSGYQNYYFVSIALVLCALGVALYFWIKRKRAPQLAQNRWGSSGAAPPGHGPARLTDPNAPWDASHTRRRYWQGRWRQEPRHHVEEGLNEHGEAPPPYIPKTQLNGGGPETNPDGGPAIPLQTLSREDAGLSKPPDYTPATTTTTTTANATDAMEGQNGTAERSTRFA